MSRARAVGAVVVVAAVAEGAMNRSRLKARHNRVEQFLKKDRTKSRSLRLNLRRQLLRPYRQSNQADVLPSLLFRGASGKAIVLAPFHLFFPASHFRNMELPGL